MKNLFMILKLTSKKFFTYIYNFNKDKEGDLDHTDLNGGVCSNLYPVKNMIRYSCRETHRQTDLNGSVCSNLYPVINSCYTLFMQRDTQTDIQT